jgi:predicted RNA methylase
MSATARSDVRVPDDFYATPAWCVSAILPFLPAGDVLDPCAGTGGILGPASENGSATLGYEIDAGRVSLARARGLHVEARDALSVEAWAPARVILMNPPFSLASEFIDRALAEAGTTTWIAALLRLNWLAGIKRAAFHRAHPADLYVLPRRPSFTGHGTDACDYAWFVWRRYSGGRWQVLDL